MADESEIEEEPIVMTIAIEFFIPDKRLVYNDEETVILDIIEAVNNELMLNHKSRQHLVETAIKHALNRRKSLMSEIYKEAN